MLLVVEIIVDLQASFSGEKRKRTMNFLFFVVPCEIVCNGILGRSFLATLDVVASPVHLKMKYHNDAGHPSIVKVI